MPTQKITEAALRTKQGVHWFPITTAAYNYQDLDELDQDGYVLVKTTVHDGPITIQEAYDDLYTGPVARTPLQAVQSQSGRFYYVRDGE